MPIDRSKYSKNWDEISRAIRDRSGGRCECLGECGHNHYMENGEFVLVSESFRCSAVNREPNPITGSIVVLTVAHLDHDTTNNNSGNLRAFCQRCHNTYDAPFRRKNAARTRRQNQIAAGQSTLFDDDLGGS